MTETGITILANGVLGALILLVGWLLKRAVNQLDDKVSNTQRMAIENKAEISGLRGWRDEYEKHQRDEAIRQATELRDIWDNIKQINANCFQQIAKNK